MMVENKMMIPPSASMTPSSPSGVPLSLLPLPVLELPALRGEGGRRRPKTRRSTAAAAAAAEAADEEVTEVETETACTGIEVAGVSALHFSNPAKGALEEVEDATALDELPSEVETFCGITCCLVGKALIN